MGNGFVDYLKHALDTSHYGTQASLDELYQKTGLRVQLGLDRVDELLLVLTLLVSMVTFASGRTNILQGGVHLVVFLAWIVLIFD